MDRRSFIVILVVATALLAGHSAAARADELKMEASADGVRIQSTGLDGTAKRISYNEKRGIIVLEGTKIVPAKLVLIEDGSMKVHRGAKIVYSLKSGDLSIDGN